MIMPAFVISKEQALLLPHPILSYQFYQRIIPKKSVSRRDNSGIWITMGTGSGMVLRLTGITISVQPDGNR